MPAHLGGVQRPHLKSLPSQFQAVPSRAAAEVEDPDRTILLEQRHEAIQFRVWRKRRQVTVSMQKIPRAGHG